jgi:GT2 family glycosyltransferase
VSAGRLRSLAKRALGRVPLDYRHASRPDPGPEPLAGPVDVVVTVRGAAAELERCAASVGTHTDLGRDRLVFVLDGPGQDEAESVVAGVAQRLGGEAVLVLRNAERRGFPATANRGMSASRRDVVLLNSDTVVTAGWIDNLRAAASSSRAVATVTPFSNDATICSLPEFLTPNPVPAGLSIDQFASIVTACARREYPRLPTGVGVCLYVKRRVLDRIGGFDEEAFGLGYGEENDFCMRATKAGFVHVLDDATFIFHEGSRSFGESRTQRIQAGERALRRRHPEYIPTVAAFIREDPLRPLRERVAAALRSRAARVDGG